MLNRLLSAALMILMIVACASSPDPLTSDADLNRFLRTLERSIERHEWKQIIEVADAEHYRRQVVEHGMPEAQYVAELFGLHHVDNNIRTGERITWSDLQRIDTVDLVSVSDEQPRRLDGTVILSDGQRLRLSAMIERSGEEWMLTGASG